MLRMCASLFLTGIILGSGPCLASCGPILISYIAGTKKGMLAGLWSWFLFSISRVAIYAFLGALAGFIGAGLFNFFYWEASGFIIWICAGAFIIFLGLLISLGKDSRFNICRILNKRLIQKDTKSIVALGIAIGFFPCAPLLGVLSYITMISIKPLHGIIMSLSFGLGTLISPLVFMAMTAGLIPRFKVLHSEKNLALFQRLCGLILVFLGSHIILKASMGFIKKL